MYVLIFTRHRELGDGAVYIRSKGDVDLGITCIVQAFLALFISPALPKALQGQKYGDLWDAASEGSGCGGTSVSYNPLGSL